MGIQQKRTERMLFLIREHLRRSRVHVFELPLHCGRVFSRRYEWLWAWCRINGHNLQLYFACLKTLKFNKALMEQASQEGHQVGLVVVFQSCSLYFIAVS